MEPIHSDSFTLLFELRKYYTDFIFKLKRTIDEKNIEILSELNTTSFKITEETQQDIQAIAALQRQISIAQATLDTLKSILNGNSSLQALASEAPNVVETLLWLLKKDETDFFSNQLRLELQKSIGLEATTELEKFSHINAQDLEKQFHLELNKEGINDYLACIESVYLPEEGVDTTEREETYENIPKDKEAETVTDSSKSNLYTNRHFTKSNQGAKQKKDLYKNMYNCLSANQSDTTKKLEFACDKIGKTKALNRSSHFDFNLPNNNLRVGTGKKPVNFFKELDSTLKAAHKQFTDANFPPGATSITTKLKKYPNVPKISWKRIPEVYSKKALTLCSDEIGPDDIHQGALGNCFFLSALSALAEQKHYIYRLFGTRQLNPAGCYSVWLCDSGEWKNYIIDDFVPCGEGKLGPYPKFSRSKGNDIWVLLLEKAYAKMHTSYYITSTGYQGEALAGLTGAPIKYFEPKHQGKDAVNNIWKFLVESTEKKFVITAAGRLESKALKHKAVGLVSAHAYALLDARVVQKADGTTERLVKMRNPWGDREWTGAWSDSSSDWTPEILQSLNYLPKALDGVFWISVEDFDKYFFQICVCQVHPDYKYSFMRMGEGKRQNVFYAKVKVDTPGFMYLSAQQKRQKFFKGNPAFRYSYMRVIVARLDDDGQIVSVVHGKCKREQSVVIRRTFEKGTYLVLVEVDWVQNFLQEVVLTAYAPMEVDMEEEPVEKYNLDSLYERIAVVYCRNPENKKVKQIQMKFGTKERSIWKTTLTDRFGLTGILFSNQEKDLDVNYRMKIKAMENYEWVTPKITEPTAFVVTPGGEERLVLLKTKRRNAKSNDTVFTYGDAFTLTHNFNQEKLKEKAKEKGVKSQILKGKHIFIYSYNYFGGMCIFYENQEKAETYHDHLEFTSPGNLINGEETQSIEVVVPPESNFLVDVKQKDVFLPPKFEKTSKAKLTK